MRITSDTSDGSVKGLDCGWKVGNPCLDGLVQTHRSFLLTSINTASLSIICLSSQPPTSQTIIPPSSYSQIQNPIHHQPLLLQHLTICLYPLLLPLPPTISLALSLENLKDKPILQLLSHVNSSLYHFSPVYRDTDFGLIFN